MATSLLKRNTNGSQEGFKNKLRRTQTDNEARDIRLVKEPLGILDLPGLYVCQATANTMKC